MPQPAARPLFCATPPANLCSTLSTHSLFENRTMIAKSWWLAGLALLAFAPARQASQEYDLVIANGRVIDPESRLDGIRWVGIRNGKISALSERPLSAANVLDARGHVVTPGFIDLHAHGQDADNYRLFALNGVTTALELEVGTENVARWYAERAGKALINHGVTVGHARVRMQLYNDRGDLLPSGPGAHTRSSPQQIAQLRSMIRRGLEQGALGVGFGLQYTPGATRWEVLEMFREAARAPAPAFVHVRAFGTNEPGGSVESFMEVISAAAITGAPLHIVHLNSMSLSETPKTLQIVQEARARGLDVTTEAYPYSAGLTEIKSALLDQFENAPDSVLAKLQWPVTGERLTRASFRRYRELGGVVVLHLNTPEMEALAIKSPLTAIASDGGLRSGVGHPRTAGTYARVLGHYVRETKAITLNEAIRKMTLLPAQRLERRAPMFRDKGRLRVGADADIAVFDANTVSDRSTYAQPALPSVGFKYVLVGGTPVVKDGKLVNGVAPGRAARAPQR
jgi:N-acyl-D-aspartate/D-glutamate deacylase